MTQTLEQLTARITELEEENERLRDAVRQQESQVLREQATSLDIYQQLAKAEQRVAEACAKWIDGYSGIHQKEMLSDTAKSFADALRRGEWRKFVKDVR